MNADTILTRIFQWKHSTSQRLRTAEGLTNNSLLLINHQFLSHDQPCFILDAKNIDACG